MKKITLSFVVTILFLAGENAGAQTVNWRSLSTGRQHVADVHLGMEYGGIAGIGYGYKLNIKRPIIINSEFSVPFGKHLTDDFKAKLGGQAEVARLNNFSFSVSVQGIFRRYQSEFVRLANFGSEFAGTLGYYRPKWYVAGELSFDKAIVTQIKNSSLMKENYNGVQDGWYLPTGGNFSYGIRSGIAYKINELYVKAGRTVSQDFKNTPTIPYYCQVGINRKFK